MLRRRHGLGGKAALRHQRPAPTAVARAGCCLSLIVLGCLPRRGCWLQLDDFAGPKLRPKLGGGASMVVVSRGDQEMPQVFGESLLPIRTIAPEGDGSSSIVARLAELAAVAMLENHRGVSAKVSSRMGGLTRGRVEAALLGFRGCQTPLGLTAREMQIWMPEGACVDAKALLRGKLALTAPAPGMVDLAFDARDLGNFLVYPQIAAATQCASGPFTFSRDDVRLDSTTGIARFTGTYRGHRVGVALQLQVPGGSGLVSAHVESGVTDKDAMSLARCLTDFFRSIKLSMAGMSLHFAGLQFTKPGQGHAATILLRLEGAINHIPNPFKEII